MSARCHCGSPAIVRIRLLPRTDREPISAAGRRAQNAPYDEYACSNRNHQQEAREAGAVLAVEAIGMGVEARTVRDDG